ncbi:MAG: DUF3604 domain-containing protein [Armatimonadota bacterium]
MRNEEIGSTNGKAVISPDEPVVAGSGGAWVVTYTAGAEGLAPGGSVRFEIPYGFTPPQLMWPHDMGYVSATCSRRDVRLSLSLEPPVTLDPEPFYYVTRWGRMVYVQVQDQPLRQGDKIVLQYGVRQALEPGATVQHFAQVVEFTVATDVDGTRGAKFSGYTLLAEQPTLRVVGAELEYLRVVTPSLVTEGELFAVKIAGLDQYGNVSRFTLPPLEILGHEFDVNVTDTTPIERGRKLVAYFDLPGQKLLEAQAEVIAASNPMICLRREPEMQLFWGDIHGHTGLSDGLGSPESYYQFGRDEAFLDFCAIADHAQYLSDDDWELIKRSTKEHNDPGRYVTLLGYEYSCNANLEHYGDKCLYYPGDEGPLLRETDINRTGYQNMAELASTWKEHGAMMVLHQHAMGTCSYYDPDLVRLAEVYSVWGGSESEVTSRPLIPSLQNDYSGHYAADALAQGWQLGLIASSDDHAGRPGATDWLRVKQGYPGGLVAVWAPELTREAVFSALWNRRCYGTTGARIILEFSVDGEPMGGVIHSTAFSEGHHQIRVKVLGDEELQAVEILRGREVIHVETSFTSNLTIDIVDSPPPGSANYYYVRVLQLDGEMAWSSPVWVG